MKMKKDLSLREYYAAKAMAGKLASLKDECTQPHVIAQYAFMLADAMIRAEQLLETDN